MLRKYTKAEEAEIVSIKECRQIAWGLEKTGRRAISEIENEDERLEILKKLKSA